MQIGNFSDWKGLPNVHILFCLHKNQVSLTCNENKDILCCQFDDTIEVYFLLGINILGSSFWMVNIQFRMHGGLQVQELLNVNELRVKIFACIHVHNAMCSVVKKINQVTDRSTQCSARNFFTLGISSMTFYNFHTWHHAWHNSVIMYYSTVRQGWYWGSTTK